MGSPFHEESRWPWGGLPATLDQLMHDERAQGQTIRVGVIDTGIQREGLERRFQRTIDVEGTIFSAHRSARQAYTGQQSAPHGTSVAGILVRHVPTVSLVSADVYGSQGMCDAETLIHAIQWCTADAGCQVLNLSLGVTEDRLMPVQRRWQLQRIIEECYHSNIVVVAAAHNDHPQYRSFPAVIGAPLIGVQKGPWHADVVIRYNPRERVEFEATGSSPDDLLTATPASSWAAPHVTALVVKLLSLNPALKPFDIKSLLRRYGSAHEYQPPECSS